MFISDEAFAQLHQEFMLEHKAKLRMITDNNKLYRILQEIKEIAETELSYDMVGNEHRHYRNYDFIRHLITKAEEE